MCDSCSLHNRPAEVRFWAKVQKTDSCWLWTGVTNPDGYGKFKVAGKMVYAHRFAYELLVGPIPKGLQLDHLCRVRHCVNVGHLEPVTSRTNSLRGNTIPAHNTAKTHCPQGHPYDETNTLVRPGGWRHCRTCRRTYDRARNRETRRAAR